jgi:murein DD-endopeptidase MepM/ murein hydrolase activator NlpD
MLSDKRNRAARACRPVALGLASAMALSAAGCSADVTRFDFPSFGLTGGGATGSLPAPSEPLAGRGTGGNEAYAGPPARGGPVSSADAGAAERPYASSPYPSLYPTPARPGERVATRRENIGPPTGADVAPEAERPARWTGQPPAESRTAPPRQQAAAETIQVQQGDTLYAIAKRHGVSISALIEANSLTHGSVLKPGQQLVLPSGGHSPSMRTASRTPAEASPPARAIPAAKAPPPPTAAAAPASVAGWEGRHTMKAGDSLYGIARQHKVTLAELMRVNGITEPTRVRVGAVLRVPGSGEPAPQSAPPSPTPPARGAQQGAPALPKIINAPAEPQREAALGDRRADVPPVAATEAASSKFRWPVRGRVIAGFGKRPDGTNNDGINLAVPHGTEVHAAESGRVVYAGSELKGYGNLILVRHDNGWVTAYAHNEQMLVKRDDVVRRGQIIAKAGKTGTVDQPQVHFELRQGSKPVDPLPHMEK